MDPTPIAEHFEVVSEAIPSPLWMGFVEMKTINNFDVS